MPEEVVADDIDDNADDGILLSTPEMPVLGPAEYVDRSVTPVGATVDMSELCDLRAVLDDGRALHEATRSCVVSLSPSEAAVYAERTVPVKGAIPGMSMSPVIFGKLKTFMPDLSVRGLLFNPVKHGKLIGRTACTPGDKAFDLCMTAHELIVTLWPDLTVRTRFLARKVAVCLHRYRVTTRFGNTSLASRLYGEAVKRGKTLCLTNQGKCARREIRSASDLSRLDETLVDTRARGRSAAVMTALGLLPQSATSSPTPSGAESEHEAADSEEASGGESDVH
jgi:hypothetical protein